MATVSGTDPKWQEALKPGIPTLHHLSNSQSQRIIWCLEELQVEYNLVKWERKAGRAPAELQKVHFLGQAPTLITSNGQTIVESPVILTYLLKLYDTTDKYHPTSHQTSETVTSFTASSLGPITTTELIFELLAQQTPWPFSYIMNALRGKIQQAITRDGFRQGFVFLDKELGDQEWFNGTIPGQADFMAEFWVSMCVVRGWVDLEKMAPRLAKWRERVWQQEAWKRGIERGGEYDLKMLGP